MKKIFIILGVLFLISLIVTILAGNLSRENIKNTSLTLKKSFLEVQENISETSSRINDSIQKKFKETREYWKKKREEK